MKRMYTPAWKEARKRAAAKWGHTHGAAAHPGFATIRVHDLKHSFGRRLRAAGVTLEDRKVLLGHKNGSVTSHYSGAELGLLIEAANKVSATDSRPGTDNSEEGERVDPREVTQMSRAPVGWLASPIAGGCENTGRDS
ncbi:hypothetical protein D9M70_526230 [compost metagenome]